MKSPVVVNPHCKLNRKGWHLVWPFALPIISLICVMTWPHWWIVVVFQVAVFVTLYAALYHPLCRYQFKRGKRE